MIADISIVNKCDRTESVSEGGAGREGSSRIMNKQFCGKCLSAAERSEIIISNADDGWRGKTEASLDVKGWEKMKVTIPISNQKDRRQEA